jgi:hypothetical protein
LLGGSVRGFPRGAPRAAHRITNSWTNLYFHLLRGVNLVAPRVWSVTARLLGPATVKYENHRRLINREFDLSYDNTQHHRQAISNQHLTRLPISTTSFTHRPHSPTIPPPPRAEDAEVQCELLSSVFMRIGGSGLDVTAPNPPSTDTSFQRQRHNSRNGLLFTLCPYCHFYRVARNLPTPDSILIRE